MMPMLGPLEDSGVAPLVWDGAVNGDDDEVPVETAVLSRSPVVVVGGGGSEDVAEVLALARERDSLSRATQ